MICPELRHLFDGIEVRVSLFPLLFRRWYTRSQMQRQAYTFLTNIF
jgi:hypothetical protein